MKQSMMYIAYKKINGYTISDNTDHQRFLYRRGVSAPTILVIYMQAKQKLLHRKDRKLTGMLNMRLHQSALQKSSQKNIEWENE